MNIKLNISGKQVEIGKKFEILTCNKFLLPFSQNLVYFLFSSKTRSNKKLKPSLQFDIRIPNPSEVTSCYLIFKLLFLRNFNNILNVIVFPFMRIFFFLLFLLFQKLTLTILKVYKKFVARNFCNVQHNVNGGTMK